MAPRTARNPQGAGARSKRSPERAKRILDALRAGGTRRAACALGGISEDTFARWQVSSADFADAVKKAEAETELRCTKIVLEAALDSWQAAAWWLERRRPEDYGRRERVELDIQQRAHQIAAAYGLDAQQVVAEAEAWLRRD